MDELWPITLWLTTEDEERLERLAERLDVAGSKVVGAALRSYENDLNTYGEYIYPDISS